MEEIFWGVYERNNQGYVQLLGEEAVTPAEQVTFPDVQGVGLGSGWAVYQQVLATRLGLRVQRRVANDVWPKAAAIALLGGYYYQQGLAVPVEQAMPVYLRDKVAKTEVERAQI